MSDSLQETYNEMLAQVREVSARAVAAYENGGEHDETYLLLKPQAIELSQKLEVLRVALESNK